MRHWDDKLYDPPSNPLPRATSSPWDYRQPPVSEWGTLSALETRRRPSCRARSTWYADVRTDHRKRVLGVSHSESFHCSLNNSFTCLICSLTVIVACLMSTIIGVLRHVIGYIFTSEEWVKSPPSHPTACWVNLFFFFLIFLIVLLVLYFVRLLLAH